MNFDDLPQEIVVLILLQEKMEIQIGDYFL
jgi:hypothetical protein